MSKTNIKELLQERGKVHGDFKDHARITQSLKYTINREIKERVDRGQGALSNEQVEALHMIVHKIGRIIAGQADYHDHWDDIAGYATLCSKKEEK